MGQIPKVDVGLPDFRAPLREAGRKKKLAAYLCLLHTTNPPITHFSHPLVSVFLFIMGSGKKEATRRVRQKQTGDGLNNVRVKGENFYRYVHHDPAVQLKKTRLADSTKRCEEGQAPEHVQGGKGATQ